MPTGIHRTAPPLCWTCREESSLLTRANLPHFNIMLALKANPLRSTTRPAQARKGTRTVCEAPRAAKPSASRRETLLVRLPPNPGPSPVVTRGASSGVQIRLMMTACVPARPVIAHPAKQLSVAHEARGRGDEHRHRPFFR